MKLSQKQDKGGEDLVDKNLLRGAIARAGMTQEKLASAIGISQNTLSAKILGRSFFDTEEIDRICDVLSIVDNNEKANIFLAPASQFRDERTNGADETVTKPTKTA